MAYDAIYAATEAECLATPGYLPRTVWAETRAAEMGATKA